MSRYGAPSRYLKCQSKHLAALNEAGYVRLRKAALDGRQRTWVSLTRAGRTAFRDHVAALTALARVVDVVDDAAVSGDVAVGSV